MAGKSGARWRVVAAVVGALTLAVTSACSGPEAQWQPPGNGSGPTVTEGPAKLPATLTFTVDGNAVDVSPATLVTVTVSNGQLDAVSLTDADGAQVAGGLDATKAAWKNTESLAYNRTYTLTVASTGEDGKPVQETRSFATAEAAQVHIALYPGIPERRTVARRRDLRRRPAGRDPVRRAGGRPRRRRAGADRHHRPADRRRLALDNDDEVHWRPKEYWTPGTKVSVVAKVYGMDLGNGLFGQEDRAASFTIGPSKIADRRPRHPPMQILINGVDVTTSLSDTYNANLPGRDYDHSGGAKISMGAQGDRDSEGQLVRHAHLERAARGDGEEPAGIMKPSLPPTDRLYYSSPVPMAVRITSSGEYVHWADWSLRPGRPQRVPRLHQHVAQRRHLVLQQLRVRRHRRRENTGKPMELTDGLGDWNLSWDEWVATAG